MRFLHIFTILGAIVGGFQMISIILSPTVSAPQQAAGAAMAVAYVVLPYCFVRALVEMGGGPQAAQLEILNAHLSAHTKLLAEMAKSAANPEAAAAQGETDQ